ncbi:MAG: DedA family protein [Saprospiraceae bacterium]|nr:DedA family protein [Saprospiraceae bacterium]MBK9629788.1 DedA family protein [Saprospiraceae bacterium]
MDILRQLLDFLLHIDAHLIELTGQYGIYIYLILFLILFSETGLVVAAILPGDSLLFAAGALSSSGNLNIWIVMGCCIVGAILGNTVNFYIGRWLGPRIFDEDSRFFKKDYLIRTQKFYDKHGGKALVIGRFLPLIRTFVPLVAGVGNMTASKFSYYNIVGAFLWIIPLCSLGYLFGNIPFVKNNFSIVILIIIVISALPLLITFFNRKKLFGKVKF